jgi:hypothetical protein
LTNRTAVRGFPYNVKRRRNAAISPNRTMVTVRGRGYTITAYNFKMKAGL